MIWDMFCFLESFTDILRINVVLIWLRLFIPYAYAPATFRIFWKNLSGSMCPFVFGGDHSISYSVVRAVSKKLGGPADILHLDVHPGIYSTFEGMKGVYISMEFNWQRDTVDGMAMVAAKLVRELTAMLMRTSLILTCRS